MRDRNNLIRYLVVLTAELIKMNLVEIHFLESIKRKIKLFKI